jgi:toxin-antitoxin system PIN domain toxin
VNLLLAFAWSQHPHHHKADEWLSNNRQRPIILCEINTAGFVRISSNPAVFDPPKPPVHSWSWLDEFAPHGTLASCFSKQARGAFSVIASRIQGHSQVADAMLIAIARTCDATLATFDHRLTHLSPEPSTVEIIPLI